MKRSLEKNLEAMTPEEREVAIRELSKITWEIAKYSHSYLWEGHGKTNWSTDVKVQLGTDVIAFWSSYHESYRHCYYTKSLTFNGNKTTCALLKNIIEKLRSLNGVAEEEPIFL
ncbi:MAG: hypothetical protein E7470_01060 [Ruminococcaceae bacterium]|nr:hypothetical protein [Oscillospiraceae bacterium]